jgi:hypothetical protein
MKYKASLLFIDLEAAMFTVNIAFFDLKHGCFEEYYLRVYL